MKEIIWHGRGGQGAFTAARLLGETYSLRENTFVLAFPSFGPERRGAPIKAFTKLDTKPIGNRSETEKADYSIFLDDTLFNEQTFNELKPDKSIEDKRVITIDGDSIAEKYLGLPITNTILLGALVAVSKWVSLEELTEAVKRTMPQRFYERNIAAVRTAFEEAGK